MERYLPVIRCLQLILFTGWCGAVVANIADERAIAAPSISAGEVSTSGCNCSPSCGNEDLKWTCAGDELLEVPPNLTMESTNKNMTLRIVDAGIRILPNDSLSPYAEILWKLFVIKVPEFHTLEPMIFRNTIKLNTIYISHAPKLTSIHRDVFNVSLPCLQNIRILRSGLLTLPDFGSLKIGGQDRIMDTMDFENNKIQSIETARINIRSRVLDLSNNNISSVAGMAFNGSMVRQLIIRGNKALTDIHEHAFVGLERIHTLDLSDTSITILPTEGLENIVVLIIERTKTLKRIPSVYAFKSITEAKLTYAHHCCAFKFPAKHDPEEYKKHVLESMKKMEVNCSVKSPGRSFRPTVGPPSAIISSSVRGSIDKPKDITCVPEPDAFNPCEDIMGYWGLRIAVWLVAILAILGNLAVLIVLVFTKADMTVPKFLMCSLAWADLCMGIYLTLIAGMDAVSIGEYFNYAIEWQTGLGCKIAGFLTVFSTELSIFTLTVITCERWYTITYAVHLNKRLRLKACMKIMAVGWIYSFLMAILPIADISRYDKTSICLPLENREEKNLDLIYLITLLVFNGLAFLTIVFCYGCMYSSIRSSHEAATPTARTDVTVAKRMALLVLVDFVCWAPMAFFAITALTGHSMISVTQTKILLVFIYPLNSCANPYLYALLTRQYRRDVFILLSRYGMCQKRAAKYKGSIAGYLTPMGNQMLSTKRSETGNQQPPSTHNTTLTNSDVPTHNNIRTVFPENRNPQKAVNDSNAAVPQESDCPSQKNVPAEAQLSDVETNMSKE